MSCEIFTKPLIQDVDNIDNGNFDLSWLTNLIPEYEENLSGIWRPIWINKSQSSSTYTTPLFPAKGGTTSSFEPCNCSDAQINPPSLYDDESLLGLCSYCDNPNATQNLKWRLYDTEGGSSPRTYDVSCCGGGCDTMFKSDDYVPKIPYLSHSYITGLVDSKHHRQFPLCSNTYLGKENFISYNESNLSTIRGASLRVDWRIQETISEIPYNKITSQHYSEYIHNTAYQKSKNISSTCGNFIMLSLPVGSDTGNYYRQKYEPLQNLIFSEISGDTPNKQIPSIAQFQQIPYGFDKETYKNMFINNEKIGSYWKWNYSSGILCWYRYYNTGITDDKRPISGVDLYISPGDVFFASNDGPEPQGDMNNPFTRNGLIQSCPSGLKITKGNEVVSIVPSGSQFAYISANIYDKFYNLYYTLLNILPENENTPEEEANEANSDNSENNEEFVPDTLAKRAFMLAATLCTSPEYDKITVDLSKISPTNNYELDEFFRIQQLNKDMLKGSDYDSVSRLNYISNKTELFDTLASKYGAYLWVPPQLTTSISFDNTVGTAPFYMSLNYDLVFSRTIWANANCRPIVGCGEQSFNKNFYYDQDIGYTRGRVRTSTNSEIRYIENCSGSGDITNNDFAFYSNLFFNDSLIQTQYTSNGCYVLSGIYPRISQPSDTKSCTDCDEYSSFYLIPNSEDVECGSPSDADTFCYATLARRLNNSPPTGRNRPERTLKDGTKRLVRSYRASFFNPYIDAIAFHSDNGVFINSYPYNLDSSVVFEKNNSSSTIFDSIYSTFITQDLGLKIYDIEIEYIQSRGSASAPCKRFPVKETCKCKPITVEAHSQRPKICNNSNSTFTSSNIFTPGLSTRYSPAIRKYGGYTQDYLDKIFGVGVVSAGGFISRLNDYRNPKLQARCVSTGSITLYNYTNTYWDIDIQGVDVNEGELYVSVDENLDVSGPRSIWRIEDDSDPFGPPGQVVNFFVTEEPLLSSKRFATKVTINGNDILYSKQTKKINNASRLNVHLQNPFLEQAILSRDGGENMILFPPSGKLLESHIFNNHPYWGGGGSSRPSISRGDEVSSITLIIKHYKDNEKVFFKFPPVRPMGTLSTGFFDPNKGLTYTGESSTPIKNNDIFYAKELLENENFDSGKVLIGRLNKTTINAINSLNDFEVHKKLRLYVKLNNKWYYYSGSNIGAYINDKQKYPGFPWLFEYNSEQNSKNLPGTLVSPVKKHINFDFINNYNRLSLTDDVEFPYLKNKCKIFRDTSTIIIPGLRHYFLIPEIDPAILVDVFSIEDITNASLPSTLENGNTIKLLDNSYWICINASSPNDPKSYVVTEFNYYTHFFSDTHIDFKDLSKTGYVYNTSKKCDYEIFLYTTDSNSARTNTVIEKSIHVFYTTKEGQIVRNFQTEDLYMRTYTVLSLAAPTPRNTHIINLFKPGQKYWTIGQISVPIAETDERLRNKYLPGKWGDVIGYDGSLASPVVEAQVDLSTVYPSSTYNNLFYKTIINNNSQTYHYKISGIINNRSNNEEEEEEESGPIQNISIISENLPVDQTGTIYYCILQPYALGDQQSYSIQSEKYNNFIPLMDLNILEPNPLNVTSDEGENASTVINSGYINIANIVSTVPPEPSYIRYPNNEQDGYFWVNFSSDSRLFETFVPTNTFYSDTLRIDNPIYWMNNRSSQQRLYPNNDNYRTLFYPSNIPDFPTITANALLNGSSFGFRSIDRSRPYWKYPIYGDRDDGTCSNSGCFSDLDHGINKAGEFNLLASYNIANNTNGISSSAISTCEFFLGYDAGLYNAVSTNSFVTIERLSLKPNNIIDNILDDCASDYIFPQNYKLNTSSPIVQNELQNTNMSTVIQDQPIDLAANEMLFRILYGESQTVNKKMAFVDNIVYTKNDVIKYSDPKITAEDIYDQILYNYDKASSSRFNIRGNIDIKGVLSVGSTTSVVIDDISISISVRQINNQIIIRAILPNGEFVDSAIWQERIVDNSYIVQVIEPGDPEPEPPSPPAPNYSIRLFGECLSYNNYVHSIITGSYYANYPPSIDNAVVANYSCGISWANAAGGKAPPNIGGCCCGFLGPCGAPCITSSITRIRPFNCRQCVCGSPQTGKVIFVPGIPREPDYPCASSSAPSGPFINSDKCTPFDVGYCQKANCSYCTETFKEKTEINFQYNWQHCRTNFSVFGHVYRELHEHIFSSAWVQPRPPECNIVGTAETDACGNIISEGETTQCTTYPLFNLTRGEMMEMIINNLFSGVGASTIEQCENGSITEVEYCKGMYGGADPDMEDGVECWWQGCDLSALGSPPDCKPSQKPGISPSLPGYDELPCRFALDGSLTQTCDEDWCGTPEFENGRNTCSEYCHVCGVARGGNRDVTRKKIFISTNTANYPYDPQCASLLCQVSYSYNKVSVTVGDKTVCVDANITSCPDISVSSNMSQFDIRDNVTSSCDECLQTEMIVSMTPQKIPFVTKTETRRCLLGVASSCSANPNGLVSGPEYLMQCGGGAPQFVCGRIGSAMVVGGDIDMSVQYECLEGVSCEIPAAVLPYELEERTWRYTTQEKARRIYLGEGNSHIPLEDIIEGVVPGSVSEPIMESYNAGGQAITRGGDISNDISTVYVWYFTYQYIKPVNIQDILRNDEALVCDSMNMIANGPVFDTQRKQLTVGSSHCSYLPFPQNYTFNFWPSRHFAPSTLTRFERNKGVVSNVSFTQTKPTYYLEPCSSSISCYNTHKVFVCGTADKCCLVDSELYRDEGMYPSSHVGKMSCVTNTNFPSS